MGTDLQGVGDTEVRLRSVVHSLSVIVGSFAAGIVLALLVFEFTPLFGLTVEDPENPPLVVNILTTVFQFVGFYAVCLAYLGWRDRDGSLFEVGLPSLRDVGYVAAGFVALLVALYVLGTIATQLGIENAENAVVTLGQENPEFFLYLIPITFLFVAPAEELLFRGIVQGLFRRAYGAVPAILIASALFGAVHYIALSGGGSKLTYVAVAATLGVILGVLYEKSQNLLVPILVHALYNAIQFYVAYLDATGGIQLPS
jgi:hypothetical protein